MFHHSFPNISSVAWELFNLKKEKKHWLVPSLDVAYQIKQDLSVFDPLCSVLILPPKESDLIKNRGPSVGRRVERIRFFFNLSSSPTEHLFLCPCSGLLEKQVPLEFWKKETIHLKRGSPYSKAKLCKELEKRSYRKVDLVESYFEYAERGSIVDVFGPLEKEPLRLELYDDQIESIRSFHPKSQRRIEDKEECFFPPAREYLHNSQEDKKSILKSQLRSYLDENLWDRSERNELCQRIVDNNPFRCLDYWHFLFHEDSQKNDSFFLEQAPWSLFQNAIEPQLFASSLKSYFIQSQTDFEEARTEKEWVPAHSSLFFSESFLKNFLEKQLQSSASTWLSLKSYTALRYEPQKKKKCAHQSIDLFKEKMSALISNNESNPFEALAEHVKNLHQNNFKVVICASSHSQIERLQFLMKSYQLELKYVEALSPQESHNFLGLGCLPLQGFQDMERSFCFLLDEDVFGDKKRRKLKQRTQRKSHAEFKKNRGPFDIVEKDLIVHKKHGVGTYLGLKTLDFHGVPNDFFEIQYSDGKIFLPVTHLNLIHKYHLQSSEMKMDKLGGQSWTQKKKKVKKELLDLSATLLTLYSEREIARGPEIRINKNEIESFAASFPFEETSDQELAINETLNDLKGPRPMDRLICGDVGYGKTEIAIRATHATAAAGFQTAILVPTTLLCAQHEKNFKTRFKNTPIRVRSISRLNTAKENKTYLKEAEEGKIQVLIGTHRLLGKDVHLKNLALLVIDEEQRFGVAHKEKLKKIRKNVHVLSMTATPIPRTLNMSLSGLKEISIMSTPPQDRLSVRTYVAPKKNSLIQEAVNQEISRGGQIFYLYNKVQSIQKCFEELHTLFPKISIDYVHGQLHESEIEKRMLRFYQGKTQILISTTIIEAGLDVPNANTLIVERADNFGLSQLYQIRGRVGRSTRRAFAYFLLPPNKKVTAVSEERLKVLEQYQELGSGFHVASHDMDMRGAGDFLGSKQSGNINTLGFDSFMELLQQCIAEAKGTQVEEDIDPEIQLGIDLTIPSSYISEISLKLMCYKRFSTAENEEEIEDLMTEMEDRFGPAPQSVLNLVSAMKIKCQLRTLKIRSLNAGSAGFTLIMDEKTPIQSSVLVEKVSKYPKHFMLKPDGRLIIKRWDLDENKSEEIKVLKGVEAALELMQSWC